MDRYTFSTGMRLMTLSGYMTGLAAVWAQIPALPDACPHPHVRPNPLQSQAPLRFDRVLAVLPNVIPSLSYVFITSRGNALGYKPRMHHLEELSAVEAEAVIHAEELYAMESKVWGRDYKPDVESEPKEDEEAHT
ncbi:hypothetical protein LXA43DRAFT_1068878 [Ganoderma leucocontextum]|nr:hypothetical protein LXA43DRAFT_1068878 [Ganoderma leucocontextum]